MPQRIKLLEDLQPQFSFDGATTFTTIESKVKIEQLFNHGRWKLPFTMKHLLFCLYLPFGIILWPIRLVIIVLLFSLTLFLPKSFSKYSKPMTKLAMGIKTKYNGLENLPKKGDKSGARILVCNHLTDFDPYPLFGVLEENHVMVGAHIKDVPIVGKLYEKFNTIYVDQNNKPKARIDVLNSLSNTDFPLLIYPEGGLNNGKTGLMMFNKFVFGLGHSICPISMKLHNDWPVEVDYINSSWFKNFFWWLLIPYHNFELTFLPHESIKQDETDSEFATRVQNIIAKQLGLEATLFNYTQKRQYAKHLLSLKSK
ncbi:hypothetical protein RB653_001300 [Dictyostelium firmibasis]|uniref:Phospholipid/glycerol acyltransferase domain-containing protein n=1 Tax=Dictyostelium firmibasis TaxID=79012 RepID=A0AAN7YRD0_9MYCE